MHALLHSVGKRISQYFVVRLSLVVVPSSTYFFLNAGTYCGLLLRKMPFFFPLRSEYTKDHAQRMHKMVSDQVQYIS